MNCTTYKVVTKREQTARILENLAREFAQQKICKLLKDCPKSVETILKDLRVEYAEEFCALRQGIDELSWVFGFGTKPVFTTEMVIIMWIIGKNKSDVYFYSGDFIRELELTSPDLANYLRFQNIDTLSATELVNLI